MTGDIVLSIAREDINAADHEAVDVVKRAIVKMEELFYRNRRRENETRFTLDQGWKSMLLLVFDYRIVEDRKVRRSGWRLISIRTFSKSLGDNSQIHQAPRGQLQYQLIEVHSLRDELGARQFNCGEVRCSFRVILERWKSP